jgi:hypothetical protein
MCNTIKIIILTVALALPASLFAAPDGYSINSDSGSINADSLYRINLANGKQTRLGPVVSLGQSLLDVEGLAFAPDGTLYGVDDASLKLFPLSSTTGTVFSQEEYDIRGVPTGGSNDFGMSFACDGNLYLTSVTTGSLYRAELDGSTTRIGSENSLGVGISALAAYGDPVKLYGLSNGVDTGSLYEININNGRSTLIGKLGNEAGLYNESGLAFDDEGQLWAITDRRAVTGGPFGSQVLRINEENGRATLVSTTTEQGFESLAITVPKGCADSGQGKPDLDPGFTVRKRFMDGNDVSPVTFKLSCNTGQPLNESVTRQPSSAVNGVFEVTFVVTDFKDGDLDCEVSEVLPPGYRSSYACEGDSKCSATEAGPCVFTGVNADDGNLCEIKDFLKPVPVDVTKSWRDENPEFNNPTSAVADWYCKNAKTSGSDTSPGDVSGQLTFTQAEQTRTFNVFPHYDENKATVCNVNDSPEAGIVADDTECVGLEVSVGSDRLGCTIYNTRLYEGVPTLNQYGLLLISLLMLMTGLVAVRRF